MRNKLVWHQVVLFATLLLLTAVRFFSRGRVLSDIWLFWWLGAVLGFLFVFFDRLVYALANSEEVGSMKIKELFFRGRIVEALAAAFAEREHQKGLVMRSALFVVIWAVLSVFTATSVDSGLARGFILGIGTHLIFDLAWDYFGGNRDVELWFWHVKKITKTEIDWFVRGSLVFYLLIIWFL